MYFFLFSIRPYNHLIVLFLRITDAYTDKTYLVFPFRLKINELSQTRPPTPPNFLLTTVAQITESNRRWICRVSASRY